MNIALLNRWITVQKKSTNRNDAGISTSIWQDDFSCRATVSNESGNTDSGEGMQKTSESIAFTVRYSRKSLGVDSMTHRILFNGCFYDIVNVDHASYKGSMIKFYCQKVRKTNVR